MCFQKTPWPFCFSSPAYKSLPPAAAVPVARAALNPRTRALESLCPLACIFLFLRSIFVFVPPTRCWSLSVWPTDSTPFFASTPSRSISPSTLPLSLLCTVLYSISLSFSSFLSISLFSSLFLFHSISLCITPCPFPSLLHTTRGPARRALARCSSPRASGHARLSGSRPRKSVPFFFGVTLITRSSAVRKQRSLLRGPRAASDRCSTFRPTSCFAFLATLARRLFILCTTCGGTCGRDFAEGCCLRKQTGCSCLSLFFLCSNVTFARVNCYRKSYYIGTTASTLLATLQKSPKRIIIPTTISPIPYTAFLDLQLPARRENHTDDANSVGTQGSE